MWLCIFFALYRNWMDRHEKWFEKSNDCLYIEGGREGRKNLRGVVKSQKGGGVYKERCSKNRTTTKVYKCFYYKKGAWKEANILWERFLERSQCFVGIILIFCWNNSNIFLE